MSLERVLGAVANGLTILAATTAFAVFFFGARVREEVACFHRWRACRAVSKSTAVRLRSRALRALFRPTSTLESPDVPQVLTLLSDRRRPNGVVDDLSWVDPRRVGVAARGLDEFARRMADSVLARVGSAVRADAHVRSARRAAVVLEEDAGYQAVTARSTVETNTGCARLLRELRAEVLAGPLWAGAPADAASGEKCSFDFVRVSERRGIAAYGIDGPLASIAAGASVADWHGLIGEEDARRLSVRAAELAAADVANDTDAYNGYFPRLLGWRVERAQRHVGRRLHLFACETTFYTWRVLNEQAHRVHVDDERLFVHDGGDCSSSMGAAHLPVAVALLTVDGFLVLRRRATKARFSPGRIESTANGNPEIRPFPGLACDRNDDGLIDMAAAARRELLEELGPVPLGSDPRALGLVVMSGDEEERAVYLMFEARTELTVDQLRERFHLADPTEGFYESSGELVALPVEAGLIGQSFDFVITAPDIRPFTRAMTAVALAAQLDDPAVDVLPRSSDRDGIRTIVR